MAGAELIVSGRIATFAGDSGWGWVEAIAVEEGVVAAAGTLVDIDAVATRRTRRIGLPPDTVALPGLTDAHVHLTDAALLARQVDLEAAATIEDGMALVAAAAARAGSPEAWVEGGGWDQSRWGRWPTADDLRAAAPGRLIALWSHDRHSLLVSHEALAAFGIDASRPDPPSGRIRHDARGDPTGVLQEHAVRLVIDHLPSPGAAEVEDAISAYTRGLVRLGLVGVHDAGDLAPERGTAGVAALIALADRGAMPIRVHASVREPGLDAALAAGRRTGASLTADPRSPARMGWLKLFVDGALGSRTALLLEPYERSLDDTGVVVTPPEQLRALSVRAAAAGIVPQVHAIGDAALRMALDVLEPIAPRSGPMARIEHVQFAKRGDLPRLAAARIAASVQPIHLRTDRDSAREAWGERAEEQAFRVASIAAADVVVAFGSDTPVEPVDPWPGLAIAVTRVGSDWSHTIPFGRAEAIDLVSALRFATVGPATVAGNALGGRLVRGSPADLVVVPATAVDEPVTPGGALERTRPHLVLVGGNVAWEA